MGKEVQHTFIIEYSRKEFTYLIIEKWFNKLWYIYKIEVIVSLIIFWRFLMIWEVLMIEWWVLKAESKTGYPELFPLCKIYRSKKIRRKDSKMLTMVLFGF